jgi:pectate lyase
MNRDNNLGMWSRGPSSNDGGTLDSGPDYTDDMSASVRVLPSSFTMLMGVLLSFRVILLRFIQ